MRIRSPLRKAIASHFLQWQCSGRAAWAILIAGVVAGAGASAAIAQDATDITTLSLEDLLNVEITTASKFAQKMSQAPSYVTVVSAADIRTYGYRSNRQRR